MVLYYTQINTLTDYTDAWGIEPCQRAGAFFCPKLESDLIR